MGAGIVAALLTNVAVAIISRPIASALRARGATIAAMAFATPAEQLAAIQALLDIHEISARLACRTVHLCFFGVFVVLPVTGGLSQYIQT